MVRGAVDGHAAYHVFGRARADVSRCIYNNPEVEVVGGLPPHMAPRAAEPESPPRLPEESEAPWNAAEGEWDGSTVEVIAREEAENLARQACLRFAEYQMFRKRAQQSRSKYVDTMAKLGIEITEANEASNAVIQTEAVEQEEAEHEEAQAEGLEEESNVSWDPEVHRLEDEGGGAPHGSDRPSVRKVRIREVPKMEIEESSSRREGSFSTTRVRNRLWGSPRRIREARACSG